MRDFTVCAFAIYGREKSGRIIFFLNIKPFLRRSRNPLMRRLIKTFPASRCLQRSGSQHGARFENINQFSYGARRQLIASENSFPFIPYSAINRRLRSVVAGPIFLLGKPDPFPLLLA